jgi:archaellum component FlaG (FlaF/FlaG flagellin family)
MKTKKILLAGLIGISVLLFVGGTVYGLAQLSKTVEVVIENDAAATVNETEYDWGTIKMYDGLAKKTFLVKNTGTKTLQLYSPTTTCSCTTVQVRTASERTAALSMHSQSNDVIDVAPGDEAEVEVVFNPAFHGPSGVGPISRSAIIKTNDPQQPELKFNLSAVVTK